MFGYEVPTACICIMAARPPTFARGTDVLRDLNHAEWLFTRLVPLNPLIPVHGDEMMSTVGLET